MVSQQHIVLVVIALCCLIPLSTSTDVKWPKPVDDFDAHLINLARFKRQASDPLEDDAVDITTTAAPVAAKKVKANFTIDWNEVQRSWEKVLSEDEVKVKWDAMESNLKNGKYTLAEPAALLNLSNP